MQSDSIRTFGVSHHYVYHAEVFSRIDEEHACVRFDLGFHVHTVQRVRLLNPPLSARGNSAYAVVPHDSMCEPCAELLDTLDGHPRVCSAAEGQPALWRYPARLLRVVDGDTIDAAVDLGFDIQHRVRLRLAGIQAPEIRGPQSTEQSRCAGLAAKAYLVQRLADNNDLMEIVSSRHGKWRRWVADLYAPDSGVSLNRELLDTGHALPWDGRSGCPEGISRMLVEFPLQTRRRIGAMATKQGVREAEVVGRIVGESLDGQNSGQVVVV